MDFFPKLFENNQLKNEVLIQYNSKFIEHYSLTFHEYFM